MSVLTAPAPDDAELEAIRERAKLALYNYPWTLDMFDGSENAQEGAEENMNAANQIMADRDTLLRALDAARARCAELEREAKSQSRYADIWIGKWTKAIGRWMRAGSTIRRLRRRWQWQTRRTERYAFTHDYWERLYIDASTARGQALIERDEARAENTVLSSLAAHRFKAWQKAEAQYQQEKMEAAKLDAERDEARAELDTATARVWHECCDAMWSALDLEDGADRRAFLAIRARYHDPRKEANRGK